MLKIGINENLILKNVEITDKDGKMSVDFTFKAAGAVEAAEDDILGETVDENGMIVTGNGGTSSIKVWSLDVPNEKDFNGTVKTMAMRIDEAANETKELQNLFMSFARIYLTQDKISFNRFQGLNLTKETLSNLLTETTLKAVTRNLAQQFVSMCQPFFGNEEFPLRVLCIRQSAAKAFPTFRRKFLQSFPFVESMAIPAEASKLSFTKYEISKGLNSDKPAAAPDAPKSTAPPADASSLFKGIAATTPDLSQDTSVNSQ